MRVNRSSRSNLRFLYGSVFFFAVLLLTMVLFTYYAIDEASKRPQSGIFAYSIFISGNDKGVGCDVVFDDSLLFSSPDIKHDTLVVVNRRLVCDTIVNNGKISIQERVLFSQESLLEVIDHDSYDTLTVNAGNNSRIDIFLVDGKMSVRLSK